MRLRDNEKSTLGLPYVFAVYRLSAFQWPFKLEVYSGHGAHQVFEYKNLDDLDIDLDCISEWIASRDSESGTLIMKTHCKLCNIPSKHKYCSFFCWFLDLIDSF